jgi:hypothetical protein
MATDRYTKFILTVIAISLSVIALRPFFAPVSAGAADMDRCGHDPATPCYVAGWGPEGTIPIANSGRFPLKVIVANQLPSPLPVIVVNPPTPMPMY